MERSITKQVTTKKMSYSESKRILPRPVSIGQGMYKNFPGVSYVLVEIHKNKLELPREGFPQS